LVILLTLLWSQEKYDISDITNVNGLWYQDSNNEIVSGHVYKGLDLIPLYLGNIENGQKTGAWASWYNNGRKLKEEFWKDGFKQDGFLNLYSRNGVKVYEKKINQKTGNGSTIHWYENGQKMRDERWDEYKLIKEISWYKSGQKEKELVWDKDNYKTYSQRFWYSNNQKMKERVIDNGNLILENCWSDNGNKIPCE